MTQHQCDHPFRHRLLRTAAVVLWTTAIALYALPKAVYALTSSASWAFLSIGLALTLGRVLVRWVASGHCQPSPQPWGLHPVRHVALVTWILREEQ